MYVKMESCHRNDAQPVQRDRQRQMHDGKVTRILFILFELNFNIRLNRACAVCANYVGFCCYSFSVVIAANYLRQSNVIQVYYEQLVLHPEEWMRKILKFLDIPWNDSVLHHEEFINKPNGVSLSKCVTISLNFERKIANYPPIITFFFCFFIELWRVERSSDQVIKPVNLEALSKWVGKIPDDVVRDMADIAPMLSVLGYDPYANPPVIILYYYFNNVKQRN